MHLAESCKTNQHTLGVTAVQELDRRMKALMEKAPSDATSQLVIRKSKEGYKGLLKITSLQGKFVAGQVHRCFTQMMNELFAEARAQIDQWKRHRFIDSDL